MAEANNALDDLRYIFESEITDENIRRYIFGAKAYKEKILQETEK